MAHRRTKELTRNEVEDIVSAVFDIEPIADAFAASDFDAQEMTTILIGIARDGQETGSARTGAIKQIRQIVLDNMRVSGLLTEITAKEQTEDDNGKVRTLSTRLVQRPRSLPTGESPGVAINPARRMGVPSSRESFLDRPGGGDAAHGDGDR